MGLFPGFRRERVDVGGVPINLVRGGDGPPVLLLHGWPQTHAMWHALAPRLAQRHTVVAADLRGYGDSGRPATDDAHAPYSFRAMAADQVALMRALGFERFTWVGHDRGGRVGHRAALDHPEAIERLAVLDILPTAHVYAHTDRALATAYFHWFFLIQPAPLPERLIAGDPKLFLHRVLGGWGGGLDAHHPKALKAYERQIADPAAVHAFCEDYRAAASIDLAHDEADADRRIECPLLVLWGANGVVGRLEADPLAVWRTRATDVRGEAIANAGHFLVEERPEETLGGLHRLLDSPG
jgi:haloacetate dehalogenase